METKKRQMRIRRRRRVRAVISGTSKRPRMSVFRSNTALYVQLIDDTKGKTLLSRYTRGKNREKAAELGRDVAAAVKAHGITEVVFDRGGYRYHGAVKELADAARKGGLKF